MRIVTKFLALLLVAIVVIIYVLWCIAMVFLAAGVLFLGFWDKSKKGIVKLKRRIKEWLIKLPRFYRNLVS